jgi:hypothetical protein
MFLNDWFFLSIVAAVALLIAATQNAEAPDYFKFVRLDVDYADRILKEVTARIISLLIPVSLIAALVTVSLISVLFGFIVRNAYLASQSAIVHIIVLVLFWLVIRTAAEVIYQLCAFLAAFNFFTSSRSDFHTVVRPGMGFQRALFQNFGISCFNAVILPFVGPFYTCAHLLVSDLEARLEFLPPAVLGRIVTAYRSIHGFAVSACVRFDAALTWPDRRGSVYSAVFGVPRGEGCRRVAENAAFKYARVFDRLCCIDSLLGFVGLAIETATGFLGWAIGGSIIPEIEKRRVAGAWGFFTAFAMLHTVRLAISGIIDAFFISYVEGKRALLQPDFEGLLDRRYETAITDRAASVNVGNQAASMVVEFC